MEKITYPPLVQHLQEKAVFYNQLYREHELKYGPLDGRLLSRWMVRTVEPIIREIDLINPEHLSQVFKAFYTQLLQLLGNKSGIVYEEEYQAAWNLCLQMPSLVGLYPARVLAALNAALASIRAHQPEKVPDWISAMDATVGLAHTVEEFLALGRINAWRIGMAHLRGRAKEAFAVLREELKQALQNSAPEADLAQALEQEWLKVYQPRFIGETGGYIGYGGYFTAPPKVAQVGGHLLVTDGEHQCAFFGDAFGRVLLTDIPVPPQAVLEQSSLKGLKDFKSKYGKQLIPFDDVISSALLPSTLVLTRASSHYLYVYGWSR